MTNDYIITRKEIETEDERFYYGITEFASGRTIPWMKLKDDISQGVEVYFNERTRSWSRRVKETV